MQRYKRTLQELTFKDNFLFAATMMDEENCRLVLERILDIPISSVEVSKEKTIVYHPEYKGVRLDVFAKDEMNTHYDVEMQVVAQHVERRARYYHAQMDMELISSGMTYDEIPNGYVIFICDFDPLGLSKYRYTIRKTLCEDETFDYKDGVHTILLSTKGNNEDEVSKELVTFLKFVEANLTDSTKDFGDSLVSRLQASIQEIKSNRSMGERYMMFEELLKDEYSAGRNEGLIEGRQEGLLEGTCAGMIKSIVKVLSVHGAVSDSVKSQLEQITDEVRLEELLSVAINADGMEAFEQELRRISEVS